MTADVRAQFHDFLLCVDITEIIHLHQSLDTWAVQDFIRGLLRNLDIYLCCLIGQIRVLHVLGNDVIYCCNEARFDHLRNSCRKDVHQKVEARHDRNYTNMKIWLTSQHEYIEKYGNRVGKNVH